MRFGILCNGESLQQWQAESVRLLMEEGHTCELLILDSTPVEVKPLPARILYYPWKNLLYRLWFRFMLKPGAKQQVPMPEILEKVPRIHCQATRKGYAEFFSPGDITQIRSKQLDFMLRYGFGILKGDILESAVYGIWSFHHDDEQKYRGIPTGFWEIWNNDPANAAILQRLTSRLDGGIILKKGFFRTIDHSWHANLDSLLSNTVAWPLQVCRDIQHGNASYFDLQPGPVGKKIHKEPGNLKMFLFLFKVFYNKLKFHYNDLFRNEKWTIGLIRKPLAEAMLAPDPVIEWLPEAPRGHYVADPFVYMEDDKLHIICEQYDYGIGRGILAAITYDPYSGKILENKTALDTNDHLAFPFIFEADGKKYCMPEHADKGDVDVFVVEEKGMLSFHKTLVRGLKAIDPVLFYHEGFWWLLFTESGATNYRLHAWYSESLWGEYSPHANNPVSTDIRSSRPAGAPFLFDGKLIRPAQDCSRHYGSRIVFNEIFRLTPTAFEERTVSHLSPSGDSRYAKGMHTISAAGDFTVIDGKRHIFIYQAFRKAWKRKIGKNG